METSSFWEFIVVQGLNDMWPISRNTTVAIAETHYSLLNSPHIHCLVTINIQKVLNISWCNFFSKEEFNEASISYTLSCQIPYWQTAIFNKAKKRHWFRSLWYHSPTYSLLGLISWVMDVHLNFPDFFYQIYSLIYYPTTLRFLLFFF